MKRVWVDATGIALEPSAVLGRGGEATVYSFDTEHVLKVFKGPTHDDFAGRPDEQRAAAERLTEHQDKLAAFPRGLPDRVVSPESVATDRKRNGRIVGYVMRRLDGCVPLYRFGEPRSRRQGCSANEVVRALLDLHTTVSQLHDHGVVIGDFNDLDVLVRDDRAYLIDADSFQYGTFLCRMFSERFVDPTLCDPTAAAPRLAHPHSEQSDWFAFGVMVLKTLLCVSPWGGVHQPSDPARRIPPARRPLERITVFEPDVLYPKPALPPATLSDELVDHLQAVFGQDHRERFPRSLLEGLDFHACATCHLEHARSACPRCSRAPRRRPVMAVRGAVRSETVFSATGRIVHSAVHDGALRWLVWNDGVLTNRRGEALHQGALSPRLRPRCKGDDWVAGGQQSDGRRTFWLDGPWLRRDGAWGDECWGQVVAGRTRFWVGERFGFGFYEAARLRVGFLFDVERAGLNDGVELPAGRSELIDATAVVGLERVWLFTVERDGPRMVGRCAVIDRAGRVVASTEREARDGDWIVAGRTGTAVGTRLLLATDEGVVRLEAEGSDVAMTRRFVDTADFVDSEVRLHATADGLFAVHSRRILRLELDGSKPTPPKPTRRLP